MTFAERFERLRHGFLYERVMRLPHVRLSDHDDSPAWRHWGEVVRRVDCQQSAEYRAAWQAIEDEDDDPWPWHRSLRHFLLFPNSYLHRYHPRRLRHYWGRLRHGIGYEDMWGGDDYLAATIARLARYLLAHSHVYPGDERWPTPEAWDADLLALAEGMEHYRGECNPYRCPTVQRAFTLLPEMFPHLWD